METITKGKYINVFVPEEKIKLFEGRNHHSDKSEPKQWRKLCFYKNRISKNTKFDVVDEYELESCQQYKLDTFYKIGALSNKDPIWDYYRILKSTPHTEIGTKMKHKSRKKNPLPSFQRTIYDKENPYVVMFSK
tara:strand:- start:104 stop:505 length:402 start_codon:yes stop_codon:yes gene_type:complete